MGIVVKSFCSSSLLEAIMHLEKIDPAKKYSLNASAQGKSPAIVSCSSWSTFHSLHSNACPKWLSKSTSIDAIALNTPKYPLKCLEDHSGKVMREDFIITYKDCRQGWSRGIGLGNRDLKLALWLSIPKSFREKTITLSQSDWDFFFLLLLSKCLMTSVSFHSRIDHSSEDEYRAQVHS